MKAYFKLLLVAAGVFYIQGALGEDEYDAEDDLIALYGDEEFISIATGMKQPVSKAPAVASVIDYESITRMGAVDIDDVLETIPGLHIARDISGYKSIYTFRGIYSSSNPQVLLLINGIPVTNLYQGDRNQVWGGMPVEAISRIEVIRGPGSAVYGADAFSGVINIITKTGREINGLSLSAQAGNFDTSRFSASYGNTWDDFAFGVVLEASRTDGDDSKIEFDAQSLLDLFSGTSASLAPGKVNRYNEKLDARFDLEYKSLRFRVGLQQRETENGVGVAQALDPVNRYTSDRWNLDATYDNSEFSDNLEVFLQASYYHTTQEIEEDLVLFPPGSTGPFFFDADNNPATPDVQAFPGGYPNGVIGNPEVFEQHTRINSSVVYKGIASHNLRAGAGYYYGDVYKTQEEKNFLAYIGGTCAIVNLPEPISATDTPCVFLPEDDRENYYVYIQDIWNFSNDWELTLGVRYDDYNDFGSTVNPRLALVWSTSHNLTTKLLYGEAFRAPSFAETRVSSNPVLLGNPNLDPEELKSYELAFDYQPRLDLGLNLNFFYYRWDDIIQYIPDGGGSSTAQNAGEQTGYGMEFEATWDLSDTLELSGNIAWQQSTDEELDADAGNSPEKQLYVQANWEPSVNWRVNLQANWVLDRNRVFGDSRSAVDDYVWVDLTVRRKEILKGLEAALLVKNLFDEDAREPSPNGAPLPSIPNDLPLAGRTLLGEIRYRF